MTPDQIREAAVRQHIAPQALDQVVAKVLAHFAGATPTPADLEAYLGGLPTWDKAGLDYAVFDKLHPNAKRHLYETHHPTPPPAVHARRPVTRSLTTEELAQLQAEGLTGAAYVEKARQMQQTPAPEPP